NNCATDVATVAASANLVVKKTVQTLIPTVSTELTYSVTVTNTGPSAALVVRVTDSIPSTMTFVRASASQGSPCTLGGQVVTCTIGTLLPQSTATITVVVRPNSTGTFTNTACPQ